MHLEIISPDKAIYKGEVKLVQFPGAGGSFEIMQNHAPLISALAFGKIKVVTIEGAIRYFEIKGGIMEVQKNKIIVLSEM
jgi:F-type H+-transporting ATPase subunit epsilon